MGQWCRLLRLKGALSRSPQRSDCVKAFVIKPHVCMSFSLRGVASMLQVVMQTQNTNTKMLRNAAVLQWHKDTQEEARLARYARQSARPLMATHLRSRCSCAQCACWQQPTRALGFLPDSEVQPPYIKYNCLSGTQVLLVQLCQKPVYWGSRPRVVFRVLVSSDPLRQGEVHVGRRQHVSDWPC